MCPVDDKKNSQGGPRLAAISVRASGSASSAESASGARRCLRSGQRSRPWHAADRSSRPALAPRLRRARRLSAAGLSGCGTSQSSAVRRRRALVAACDLQDAFEIQVPLRRRIGRGQGARVASLTQVAVPRGRLGAASTRPCLGPLEVLPAVRGCREFGGKAARRPRRGIFLVRRGPGSLRGPLRSNIIAREEIRSLVRRIDVLQHDGRRRQA